jgi:FkbM family methyltransferase
MSFISYAQNFEDVMLWRALQNVSPGFYIDVGAWSALNDSVTRAFYERGWRGINIEPNPPYYQELVECRPRDVNLRQAVSDVSGRATMYLLPQSGLSSLDINIINEHMQSGLSSTVDEVEVTTLDAIWSAHVPLRQEVHFLKIDVEGLEEAVIRGNDWTKNRPWIVVVEATKPNSQLESHGPWEPNIIAADYIFVYADGLNRFYIASERSNLIAAFQYPPNEFDHFIRYREHEAEARFAASESARVQLELSLGEAQAQAAVAQRAQLTFEAQLQTLAAQAQSAIDARIKLEARLEAAELETALVHRLECQSREIKKIQEKIEWLDDCVHGATARSNKSSALAEQIQTFLTKALAKMERAELDINYAMNRTFIERLFFRPDGRPVKPLRRLVFHNSGKTRYLFRRIAYHKNGRPRKAFSRWLAYQNCSPEFAHLSAENDILAQLEIQMPQLPELEAELPSSFEFTPLGNSKKITPRMRYFLHGLLGK